MAASEAGSARMIATLGVAGLCAGFVVVGVYLATKPVIERNRAEALEAAIYRVLDPATRRRTLVLREGALRPLEAGAEAADGRPVVYAAYDAGGALVGYAIPAEGPGFQDTIKLLYGYDPERRRVVGMQVLESRETPGLGDKILKDPDFLADFRDLAVEPRVELVKEEASAENEVDAISGATISSAAVVRIVNEANERWLERLPEEPPPPPSAAEPEAVAERGGPR